MLDAFPTDMALNPFEQLELFVSEPRQAFEDLVGMLLADAGRIDRRLRIFCGDGGIDGYQGEFSRGGSLTVYQSKYFTKPWGDSQKQQIRESFRRAAESMEFNLERWFLCIPVRLTLRDVRWLDEWRSKQSVPIELVDGDELTQMLQGGAGARTRQSFKDWGVFSVRNGSPLIQARVRCIKLGSRTGQTFRLVVSIENRGDRTAEDLRVRVTHSPTQCVAVQHDESLWNNFRPGPVNPRHLQAKQDLHAGEAIDVLQIPLVAATPFPFTVALEVWLRDQGSSRQFLTLEANQLQGGEGIDFHPGEVKAESSPDGGFVQSALTWPQDGPLQSLLIDMSLYPNPLEFGLAYFGSAPETPTRGVYRPSLAQTGSTTQMDNASLKYALEWLVTHGWLDPADQSASTLMYRMSDAAKAHPVFRSYVEQYRKRRETEG
jgi:hypothetical protein